VDCHDDEGGHSLATNTCFEDYYYYYYYHLPLLLLLLLLLVLLLLLLLPLLLPLLVTLNRLSAKLRFLVIFWNAVSFPLSMTGAEGTCPLASCLIYNPPPIILQ